MKLPRKNYGNRLSPWRQRFEPPWGRQLISGACVIFGLRFLPCVLFIFHRIHSRVVSRAIGLLGLRLRLPQRLHQKGKASGFFLFVPLLRTLSCRPPKGNGSESNPCMAFDIQLSTRTSRLETEFLAISSVFSSGYVSSK